MLEIVNVAMITGKKLMGLAVKGKRPPPNIDLYFKRKALLPATGM
jgi:hypothetical protein